MGWTCVRSLPFTHINSSNRDLLYLETVSLSRKVLTDLTLSDGTFLPRGTYVVANVVGMHTDPAYYPSPTKFDPFRFADLRSSSPDEANKHQMVNTSAEYLSFGHGRHACPGRYFAVNELKALMCWLLMNYDVKAEVEGVRPENVYKATGLSPNPFAKVLLRKRVHGD